MSRVAHWHRAALGRQCVKFLLTLKKKMHKSRKRSCPLRTSCADELRAGICRAVHRTGSFSVWQGILARATSKVAVSRRALTWVAFCLKRWFPKRFLANLLLLEHSVSFLCACLMMREELTNGMNDMESESRLSGRINRALHEVRTEVAHEGDARRLLEEGARQTAGGRGASIGRTAPCHKCVRQCWKDSGYISGGDWWFRGGCSSTNWGNGAWNVGKCEWVEGRWGCGFQLKHCTCYLWFFDECHEVHPQSAQAPRDDVRTTLGSRESIQRWEESLQSVEQHRQVHDWSRRPCSKGCCGQLQIISCHQVKSSQVKSAPTPAGEPNVREAEKKKNICTPKNDKPCTTYKHLSENVEEIIT